MSALDKGLGVAALLLAGSTIYFAWRVGVERDRSPSDWSREMTASPAGPGTPRGDADGSERAASVARPRPEESNARASAEAPRGPGGRAPREVAEAIAKRTAELAYKDPVARQQLVEERIPDLRDEYLVLERRLKLGTTRWQEFLEMLAAQTVDRNAATADCGPDFECLRRAISTSVFEQQDQLVRAFLGDADHETYKDFADALQERRGVTALQERLPQSQRLSDDATESLIAALSEVRRDTEAEISAVGGTVTSILFDEAPRVIIPLVLERPEERIEYAREYSQRLRERAATMLSGVQLARFNELQDAMLVKMRRREERMKSAAPRG